MKLSSFRIIVVLCNVLVSCYISEGNCRFCYVEQPKQSIDCNPYKVSNITIWCIIERPLKTSLEIRWFFSSQNINTTRITSSDTRYTIQTRNNSILQQNISKQTSQLFISSPLTEGRYWCEVFYNNNGLQRSQSLEVTAEDDYDRYYPCTETIAIVEQIKKCTDIVKNSASTCPTPPSPTFIISSKQTSTLTLSTTNTISNTIISFKSISSSYMSSIQVRPTNQIVYQTTTPTTDPAGLQNKEDNFHLWLYIAAGLAGIFGILIIILTVICLALCLMRPKKSINKYHIRPEPRSRTESTEFNDISSRPQTSMTVHTDIMMPSFPIELNDPMSLYDTLDQDYEDLDDNNNDTVTSDPQTTHTRYHDQGPSAATGASGHPPLQPTYSEVGEASPPKPLNQQQQQQLSIFHQMTGYGKLDHSRPRQNYYPRKDSPLLSGYRKLEHVTSAFRATTLPHNPQPGYANIEIPGEIGHLRSISLPSSEYSNLNPSRASSSQPTTPVREHPQRGYANFEVIEAYDSMEEIDHSPFLNRLSGDYHMLADATVEQEQSKEYEFLPACSIDEPVGSLEGLHLSLGRDLDGSRLNRTLASLDHGEQLSVTSSQSSADFTGPFFFPHMVDFGEPTSPNSDHHLYRALDLSKMEPEKGYALVSLKEKHK